MQDNSHKGQTAHVQTAPDASAGFNFTANVSTSQNDHLAIHPLAPPAFTTKLTTSPACPCALVPAQVPLQRSKTELMAFGRKHVQLQIKRQKGFLVFK